MTFMCSVLHFITSSTVGPVGLGIRGSGLAWNGLDGLGCSDRSDPSETRGWVGAIIVSDAWLGPSAYRFRLATSYDPILAQHKPVLPHRIPQLCSRKEAAVSHGHGLSIVMACRDGLEDEEIAGAAGPSFTSKVEPASPSPSLTGGWQEKNQPDVAKSSGSIHIPQNYYHEPIPRRPMHRSISVPLSDRMGLLRHPRPRRAGDGSQRTSADSGREIAKATEGTKKHSSSSERGVGDASLQLGNKQALSSRGGTAPSLAQLVLDTLQLPIAHLLNIIPPHLLDATHETLSATSLSVPVTSVEALLEAFRGINWVCDAMAKRDGVSAEVGQGTHPKEACSSLEEHVPSISSSEKRKTPSRLISNSNADNMDGFDVLELLQRAADLVSGQASDKAVELVLSWSGMAAEPSQDGTRESIYAVGEEGAVKCILAHTLARITDILSPGSSIAITLDIKSDILSFDFAIRTAAGRPARVDELHMEQVALKLARANFVLSEGKAESLHGKLTFDPVILKKASTVQERRNGARAEHCYENQRFMPRLALAEEPTLDQLMRFGYRQLKGKRIALHSPSQSVFAEALTEMLASYGCEVQKLPLAKEESIHIQAHGRDACFGERVQANHSAAKTAIALTDGRPTFVRYSSDLVRTAAASGDQEGQQSQAILDPVTGVPLTLSSAFSQEESSVLQSLPQSHLMARGESEDSVRSITSTIHPVEEDSAPQMESFSFLMVDDDVETLQQQLLRMRSALPLLRTALGESTPVPSTEMQALIDASGPTRGENMSEFSPIPAQTTHAIIFFSSIANYRSIRDVIQPIMESALRTFGRVAVSVDGSAVMPQIVLIPKPAGARRVLTSLYTAMYKPLIDPFFAPIATSPLSPHLWEAKRGWARLETALYDVQRASTPSVAKPTVQQYDLITTPSTPPLSPQSGLKPHLRTSPSPGRGKASMKIPNFPRADAGSLTMSPSLGTPLRQEISAHVESGSSSSSSPNQHLTPSASPFGGFTKQGPSAALSPLPSPMLLPTPSVSTRSSHGSSSPMPVEALEYFSETASKLGSSGGASGMVIATIDGRPAGIFFQPKGKGKSSDVSQHSCSGKHGSSTSGSVRGAANMQVTTQASSAATGGSRNRAATEKVAEGVWRRLDESHASPLPISDQARPLIEMIEMSSDDTGAFQDGQHPSPFQRCASLPSSKGSHSDSSEVRTTVTSPPRQEGTLFTPQVNVKEVLSSNFPLRAAPLATASAMPSCNNAAVDSAAPEPLDRGTQDTGATVKNDAKSSGVSQTNATGSPIAPSIRASDITEGPEPAAFSTKDAGHEGDNKAEPASPNETKPHAEGPDEPTAKTSTPRAATAAPGHPQPRFFSASLAGAAARPSAQPQSGLLIGAGFAPTARRGAGLRRAAVREKILPPIKVLIVEDNPINQRILKQFMTRKGIKFETAVNGKEAVEKWATGGFHLILMDIQLPVMDGIEATTEIRKQEDKANVGILPANSPLNPPSGTSGQLEEPSVPPSTPTPSSAGTDPQLSVLPTPFQASVIIVALTASSLNSDRVAALAAGCNDFLQKPVNLVWLEKKIIEWGSMQYILLSGAGVFDAERKAARLAARGASGDAATGGRGALAAATASSDVCRAFGQAPNVQARQLANRLYLPAMAASKERHGLTDNCSGAEGLQRSGGMAGNVGVDTLPYREARILMTEESTDLKSAVDRERIRAASVALDVEKQSEAQKDQ